MRRCFVVALLSVVALHSLAADRFELKNGDIVQGRMVGITEDGRLRIQTDDGERLIPQSRLKAILRDLPSPESSPKEQEDRTAPADFDGRTPADTGGRFRASMLIPGLYQIQNGRPVRGGAILGSFLLFSASSAALYSELNANARAASGSIAYQLYFDQSFEERHRNLTLAFQASRALSVAVLGAHVVDMSWFAPGPGQAHSSIVQGGVGFALVLPVDW